MSDQAGFDINGEFFPLSFTSGAKDILLVDRITQMSLDDFQAAASTGDLRGSVLLGMIATSIRARRPDWSVERIVSMVMDIDLADLKTFGGDDADPTAGGQPEPPNGNSDLSSEDSSSSATQTETWGSATSAVTPH